MQQGFERKLAEAKMQKTESGNFADPNLFKIFHTGNSMAPQAEEGISILLADSILKEKDFNWQKFATSQLSPAQIDELGDLMDYEHVKRQIPVVTDKNVSSFPEQETVMLVRGRMFENLWRLSKYCLIKLIIQYILNAEDLENLSPEDRLSRIQEFFQNQGDNALRIMQLREAMEAVVGILSRQDMASLLKEYQDGFGTTKSQYEANRKKWREYYLPTLKENFLKELEVVFQGKVPEDIKGVIDRLGH